MQIEIIEDENCTELKIIILTKNISHEVNEIIKKLSEESPQVLLGFRDGAASILNENELYRIYSASSKIYAVTDKGEYTLRLKLYELEQKLDKTTFVRISNSEIINFKKAINFDLSIVGTICINLADGTRSYVSRRYVSKIKQLLGI
jgi:DNA-binding LytR/AlgR family response regulator